MRLSALPLLLFTVVACGTPPPPQPPAPPVVTTTVAVTTTPPIPDRQPHTLVLNATGSGDAMLNKIKYSLDGQVQEEGATQLPWRKSLSVPADGLPHSWELSITYTAGRSAKLDVFALYDGKEMGRTAGGGGGTGNTKMTGGASIGGRVNG
ncbi:hypothetical protein NLX83_31160 [Allokutzneria sp. A3M-2-11 16]|uniref:hypothetical protein n=1 Tax=Allokutzneria sp. A3M-2-11 16 TaxID=2962043 RepID=UPI0020B69561|nr:hypothetical protein [Allokutzneria sp. A3M-2-11 16]MCP3803741.1 hypothetical protein [Allokutzneria sp. A3M-2-11 16]